MPKVNKLYFEGACLTLIGEGHISSPSLKKGKKSITPLIFKEENDTFFIKFDLISGLGRYPLDEGEWEIDLPFEGEAFKDYSQGKVIYKLWVTGGEKIKIKVEFKKKFNKKEILQQAVFTFLRLIFGISNLFCKKTDVLFTSESRDSLGGNMEYVAKEGVKYSFLNKNTHSYLQYVLFLIKTAFMLGKAKTVVLDDYHPIIYQMKFKPSVKVIQLWHACGAFKSVGYARSGKEGALNITHPAHRNYTHAIVSGEGVRACYSEAFGIPIENVLPLGVPRTDSLLKEGYKAESKEEIEKIYPISKGKKKVLFAPTFRGEGKAEAYYPTDKIDLSKLKKYCEEKKAVIFFKMHPFVKQKLNLESELFIDASDCDINKIIACSEVVITDYSSLIYEASLLDTAMLFYVFDLEEYTSSRSFFKPFESYLAGKSVFSFDELTKALENQDYQKEKIKMLASSSLDGCDGKASDRIKELIYK